jgi:rhamnosyltransferase
MVINGFITLYLPTEDVVTNIHSYLPYLNKLIVVDNSPNKFNFDASLIDLSKIIHIHTGENLGIAKSLNKAIEISLEHKVGFLLTMDQDTQFLSNHFNVYKNFISEWLDNKEIVMFGISTSSEPNADSTPKYNEILITSGSIINLKYINQIGFFDEKLFIDEVDTEFCYRIIASGLFTLKLENICLKHSIGKSKLMKVPFSNKYIYRYFHSPQRVYYMIRNFLYVNKIYGPKFGSHRKHVKKSIANTIKNNLLYNHYFFKTIKAVFLGYKDYRKNKFGVQNYFS